MFRPLICLFIACSLHLSATDHSIANYISEHAENTIARVESDKIFLHPEYLHFENGRAYLEVAYGDFLELPTVTSEGSESYISTIRASKAEKTLGMREMSMAQHTGISPPNLSSLRTRQVLFLLQLALKRL